MRHIHAAGRMMRSLRHPACRVDTSAAFPRLPKLAGKTRDAFYTTRAASSSTSTASGSEEATAGADRATTSTRLSQAEVEARLQQLRELVQEIVKTVISTGPRGFARGFQAANGVLELAGEYLQRGRYDEPEVFLRKLFEKLGATYIKLGQFIASSPSLFPEPFVMEFQKCLDRTEPVPFEKVRAVVQAELGTPIDEVFSFFDPQPLASASIAQVHAAVLRRSNKEVVVKVLKPDVEDVLTTDLNFLYLASRALEVISPQFTRLSLSAIVGDMRASMMDEVDFMKEARNIREFSKYLDATGMRSFATCPEVYPSSSGKRVLVMERLVGVPLTDLDAIRSVTNADPELTLINALNTWFGSVLACETFHADVHAGNLLVLQDGRVGFIDFGIVGRISPLTWKALEALMQGTATEDYRMIAAALATMGATEEDVDVDAFAEDLRQLFKEIQELDSQLVVAADATSGTTSVSANVVVDETQVNRLVIRLAQVSEKNGVRIPREFGLLMKQLLYFDRYTRILAPQLSVLTDSRIQFGSLSRSVDGSPNPIDFRSQGPSGRSIRVSGA